MSVGLILSALAYGTLTLAAAYLALQLRRFEVPDSRATTHQCFDVVIPCHNEFSHLENAVDFFSHVPGCKRIVVLLSSTSRAALAAEHQDPNATFAFERDSRGASLLVVECPASCGTKAAKLAHFWHCDSPSDVHADFFLVVDVDSRPTNPSSLRVTTKLDTAATYQALVYVCADRPIGFFARALAMAQAERTALEAWAMTSWEGVPRPFMLGLMGAGMGFNRKALEALSPWPIDSDDIRVGYRADLLHIPRYVLRSKIEMEPAPSVAAWWKQSVKISAGVRTRLYEAGLAHGISSYQALRTAFCSALFDWIPGLRLAIGGMTVALALRTDFALGCFVTGVVVCTTGAVAALSYAALRSRANVTVYALGCAVAGGLIWPIARTAAAIGSMLLGRAVVIQMMQRPTDKNTEGDTSRSGGQECRTGE